MNRQEAERKIAELNQLRREMALQVRARGRLDYVVRYGVLRIGLGLALLLWLAIMLVDDRSLLSLRRLAIPLVLQWLLLALVAGCLFGVAWSLWYWRIYQRTWFARFDAESASEKPGPTT